MTLPCAISINSMILNFTVEEKSKVTEDISKPTHTIEGMNDTFPLSIETCRNILHKVINLYAHTHTH